MTIAALVAGLAAGGCANHLYDGLPRNDAAYKIAPPANPTAKLLQYNIIPGDELAILVAGEPDLSIPKLVVDQAGNIQVPMVGSIAIGGMSPAEAAKFIETRLGERYIRNPSVAINITTPAQRLVSVEGQVTKPGAYPVTADTTLLTALAMAESPTRIARLDEVVVFRTKDGQRLAARFDLERIRAGLDPDPQILGGDNVVIGFSQAKSVYRDVLTAAPLFNIFTRF